MISRTAQEAAIARVRSFVPSDRLAKADRVAHINGRYLGFTRDNELKEALENCVASIAVIDLSLVAKPDKRRIVVVIGESGAGKTTALIEHTSTMEVMQPYTDAEGSKIMPLLAFNAPSPCTPQKLALEGLRTLGYPADLTENKAWAQFREMLKAHKVHWILVDELQHAIDTATKIEVAKIANSLKELVQMPDWPVRVIVAGIAPLAGFVSQKQLSNRKTIVRFKKLTGTNGDVTIAQLLKTIVIEHAAMRTTLHENPEFLQRLGHAASRDVGTTIQTIRSAIELAIMADTHEVMAAHFESAYRVSSGCEPHENVFTAKNFLDLDPDLAALGEEDKRWRKSQERRLGREY